jgi:hypothetical protein
MVNVMIHDSKLLLQQGYERGHFCCREHGLERGHERGLERGRERGRELRRELGRELRRELGPRQVNHRIVLLWAMRVDHL